MLSIDIAGRVRDVNQWTVQDWSLMMIGIGTLITGIIASVGAVLANLAKIRAEKVESKVDHNTTITEQGTAAVKEGTAAAVVNAKAAVTAANEVKTTTDNISKKLNGGVDAAITAAVKPIQVLLEAHIEQDKNDLEHVKTSFAKLEEYIHTRNHDVLDALNKQAMKIEVMREEIKRGSK